MAGYSRLLPAQSMLPFDPEEEVAAPGPSGYATFTPTQEDPAALMERLRAGTYSAQHPGRSLAEIQSEVAQRGNAQERSNALQNTLGRLMARGEQTAPMDTLKSLVPLLAAKSKTQDGFDLSTPEGMLQFLAKKSGTGAENINYLTTLMGGVRGGQPLTEAVTGANAARSKLTQENAFARGQGYGTGANTGPAAEAKTTLAGNIEQRKLDVQTTPQPGLGGKSPAQAMAEQKSVGGLADDVRKNEISMFKTRAILADLDAQSKRIFTATDPGSAALQRITGPVGAFTKTNPNAAAYNDTKESALGELARSISAERGVLTNFDIQRIQKAMPDWGDTQAIRDFKMSRLQAYVNILDEMNKALLAPEGVAKISEVAAQYKPQLDQIINDLEKGFQGVSPQAPRKSRGVIGTPREIR